MKQDESQNKNKREKVVNTATYRGIQISVTNRDRYIVVIENHSYPAGGLSGAKKLIDDYYNTRRN